MQLKPFRQYNPSAQLTKCELFSLTKMAISQEAIAKIQKASPFCSVTLSLAQLYLESN